jgi:hypothetical protein
MQTQTDPIGSTKAAPGKPSEVEKETHTNSQNGPIRYILYFREGRNPHPQFVTFDHPSTDMKVVVERVKRFCDTMGQRFVSVSPMLVDLDKEEIRRRGE